MAIVVSGHSYVDARTGVTLDAWFPDGIAEPRRACLAQTVGLIRGTTTTVELVDLAAAHVTSTDVYHRLHLLSLCEVKPNEVNLDGLLGLLRTVAWIADADRVRLGAHLVPGTTVMHEGLVNFNAGTLGPAMIEGRVTPGVTIGANSDIGAGSSIMGTLSGGGKQVNAVGQNSLLGANAGIGISLGDRCIVEAGLYLTAGIKVKLVDGSIVPARELSGVSDLLFRRNSQTGVVEAVSSASSTWGGLDTDLHGGAG
ncbi:MAG: tetrahydrodipicolinate succinyltransferase [Actinomycetia bacterium]|nr:tetrahydrodipicolinate succinyltransferase [Actinomycetes bacterium]MCP4228391.1 tetrahydrodipicolinate succinyltransferase [Actinomycetes bacterium]MCP5031441.1 tetrahydrodipicolinate succinyltransferase [Actinomycetes bacterium]